MECSFDVIYFFVCRKDGTFSWVYVQMRRDVAPARRTPEAKKGRKKYSSAPFLQV